MCQIAVAAVRSFLTPRPYRELESILAWDLGQIASQEAVVLWRAGRTAVSCVER